MLTGHSRSQSVTVQYKPRSVGLSVGPLVLAAFVDRQHHQEHEAGQGGDDQEHPEERVIGQQRHLAPLVGGAAAVLLRLLPAQQVAQRAAHLLLQGRWRRPAADCTPPAPLLPAQLPQQLVSRGAGRVAGVTGRRRLADRRRSRQSVHGQPDRLWLAVGGAGGGEGGAVAGAVGRQQRRVVRQVGVTTRIPASPVAAGTLLRAGVGPVPPRLVPGDTR